MPGSVRRDLSRGRVLLSSLCSVFLIAGSASAATPASEQTPKRSVHFELENTEGNGALPVGKSLALSVQLTGVPVGDDPVVAIFEGASFARRLVPLTPDPDAGSLRASVTLEPYPLGRTSVQPKYLRIHVVFARLREMKIDRFLTRTLYVTIGQPQAALEPVSLPPRDRTDNGDMGLPPDEAQPDVTPVLDEGITEEDLLPLPVPGQAQDYWREVTRLISGSWGQGIGQRWQARLKQALGVRFRLHANGEAQLIQVERSSGTRELDEAGMRAIVNAHPFPPFPEDLDHSSIEVHVRMRAGFPESIQNAQSAPPGRIDTQPSSPNGSGSGQ